MVAPEVVARFSSRMEADLARSLLTDNGIDARVTADDAGGLHPELSMVTGGVGLLVAPDDLALARELLGEPRPAAAHPRDRLGTRRRLAVAVIAVAVVLLVITSGDALLRGGLLQL